MKCKPTHQFQNASGTISNSSVMIVLWCTLRLFFQRAEMYLLLRNYTTTVTALRPYQFSILSEVQNAKPTLSEPTLKECSNGILISIYKPNPPCCLQYQT